MTIPHLREKCNAPARAADAAPPSARSAGFRPPVSGIGHQASGIRHRASGIGYPASGLPFSLLASHFCFWVGRRCVGVAHPLADRDGAGLDGVSPHRRLPRPRRSAALPTATASRHPTSGIRHRVSGIRHPASPSPSLLLTSAWVGRRCAGVAHPLADRDGAGLDGVSPHQRLPRPRRSAALPFRAVPHRADRSGAGRCARAGPRSPPVSRRNRSPAAIWGQYPDG